jgi:hypothetical protein
VLRALERKPFSGVRYDAARSFAEARGYKCSECLDRALLVVPDREAREAREIIRRITWRSKSVAP